MKSQNTPSQTCLSIQQVGERTGLSVYTLRYYEQVGLIGPIQRDAGGRRCYTTEDVAWIALLILARDTGMPLAQIQEFGVLMQQGASAAQERFALMEAHRAQVQAQVDVLCANLNLIEQKVVLMRRVESDPNEYAQWRERCLEMLQKRNAGRTQSATPVTEARAKTQTKKVKNRHP